MNCTGSRKFQKVCFCSDKWTTENSSRSFNCSSSTISSLPETDDDDVDKNKMKKQGKKNKSGIFSSFFTSKIFSPGFRKDVKTVNPMLKVERIW
ncbi:hypothetical protein Phum_PHUM427970 [Pediculus humanus corporis]|uniref:Uncharacterized protein n=1 Tax=Pediculus humanus subsp. corporis TaxID=121224 RepID=E0VT77_PEDHC|nr:uncharacterized protein Phum_PHUM427970 [Pediculus humanus corporis]EEB16583.1 hypothetical protein Phum_PHUM427970 [Pediculus humanus corporis]